MDGNIKHKVITIRPKIIIVYLVTSNFFSAFDSYTKISLLALKPIRDKNVEADESPAERIPQINKLPRIGGRRFIDTQIIALSGGVISGLTRFTAAAL